MGHGQTNQYMYYRGLYRKRRDRKEGRKLIQWNNDWETSKTGKKKQRAQRVFQRRYIQIDTHQDTL